MSTLRWFAACSAMLMALLTVAEAQAAAAKDRITILYDAFGKDPAFQHDWGFSALIEYGGKRILFDTGNDPKVFAHNVWAAKLDLSQLDFVVISHRHLDHTAGLNYLLEKNPGVTIYAPDERFGPFGSRVPSNFYRRDESLPEDQRYFDGHPADSLPMGTAWPGAHFVTVDGDREIAPGIRLVSLVSDNTGTKELRELSLALDTPEGTVLVVGCSHPGIVRIVEQAAKTSPHIRQIFGGFHLLTLPDDQISDIGKKLHDQFHVERLSPGHCTGEPAFARFKQIWGKQYIYAGAGSVLPLP